MMNFLIFAGLVNLGIMLVCSAMGIYSLYENAPD